MKKLFKKPAFWVFLTVIIGLIVARIIQVKNNLKKTAANSGAKLGAGAIAKAFFSQPIFKPDQSYIEQNNPKLLGQPNGTGGIKPLSPIIDLPLGNIPVGNG